MVVRYGTDDITDFDFKPLNTSYKKTQNIPLKWIVTDVNGNEVQTPYSDPRITVDWGQGQNDAICRDHPERINLGASAFYHNDHYHCDITADEQVPPIPKGDVTIAIHLDDAIDPSTISADREHTVEIR